MGPQRTIRSDVAPDDPWYHWWESGVVPVAVTDSVAVRPLVTDRLCVWVVIEGAEQLLATNTNAPSGFRWVVGAPRFRKH